MQIVQMSLSLKEFVGGGLGFLIADRWHIPVSVAKSFSILFLVETTVSEDILLFSVLKG